MDSMPKRGHTQEVIGNKEEVKQREWDNVKRNSDGKGSNGANIYRASLLIQIQAGLQPAFLLVLRVF